MSMNELFDDFAEVVSHQVARAWFFTACVLLVVVWIPSLFLLDINTSQLLINTATTIITFLLVALLQNTQDRSTRAINHKLDVIIDALATQSKSRRLKTELREIAGTEMESSKKGTKK